MLSGPRAGCLHRGEPPYGRQPPPAPVGRDGQARRERALQEGARHHVAAGRAHPGRRAAPRFSTSAPTTTSASPTTRDVVEAAAGGASTRYGYGLASVRFICGTQDVHKELEAGPRRVPRHRGHHPLLLLLRRQRRPLRDPARRGGRDHLRRAQPRQHHRRHPPLQGRALPLRATATWPSSRRSCKDAKGAPLRLIATDGVFSMDGTSPTSTAICDLADTYDAGDGRRLATPPASSGETGRGTPSTAACMDRVDIITSTLGKALGGAVGRLRRRPPAR